MQKAIEGDPGNPGPGHHIIRITAQDTDQEQTTAATFPEEVRHRVHLDTVGIADTAQVRIDPIRPGRLLNSALAFVLELKVAVGLTLLVEVSDTSLRSPGGLRPARRPARPGHDLADRPIRAGPTATATGTTGMIHRCHGDSRRSDPAMSTSEGEDESGMSRLTGCLPRGPRSPPRRRTIAS